MYLAHRFLMLCL